MAKAKKQAKPVKKAAPKKAKAPAKKSAALDAAPAPAIAGERREIPFKGLLPSQLNPRKTFDKESIAELAESIAASGLLENLVVRPAANGFYEVIAGGRRLRALELLVDDGRWKATQAVPCLVMKAEDDTALAIALLENLQREDVPPFEEAQAFVALQKLDRALYTTAELAARVKKTQRYVQERIAMATKLSAPVKKAFEAGEIGVDKVRIIAGAPAAMHEQLLDEAQYMTAAEMREWVADELPPVGRNLFKLDDYKGEIVEIEGKGGKPRKCFADPEAFSKAQSAAVMAKFEELKAKVDDGEIAWVGIYGQYEGEGVAFEEWRFKKQKPSSKTGVAIVISTVYGVEIHHGLVEKTVGAPPVRVANSGREPKEKPPFNQAAVDRAKRRKTEILQEALFKRGMDMAVRITVFGLLLRTHAVALHASTWDHHHREHHNPALVLIAAELLGVTLERPDLNDLSHGLEWDFQGEDDDRLTRDRVVDLWQKLGAMDRTMLEKLFCALTSLTVGIWPHKYDRNVEDDFVAVAIAADVGITNATLLDHLDTITVEDLTGLRKDVLHAMRAQAGLTPLSEAVTVKDLAGCTVVDLRAIENGNFVPAHLRLGSDEEKMSECILDTTLWDPNTKAAPAKPKTKKKGKK